jgi:hypothetical protein
MSYRPITDMWFLARARLKSGRKYYGAYLGGFPERARALIGASIDEPVLHVCGGMARFYPYRGGFGERDETLDLDPATMPDFQQDARDPFPTRTHRCPILEWEGILIDPPYSPADAANYAVGAHAYPSPSELVENALAVLAVGRKVGIIHYALPRAPKDAKFIACAGVVCGFGNRIRVFSVFEKLNREAAKAAKKGAE